MSIKLTSKIMITEIIKPSQTPVFKGALVGDIVVIQVAVKRRHNTPRIQLLNTRTGASYSTTFNRLMITLDTIKYEEIRDGENALN